MTYRYPIDMTKFRVRHAVLMTRMATDKTNELFPALVAMLSDLAGFDVENMPYAEFTALMEDATAQMTEYFQQAQQQPRLSIVDIFANAIENEPGRAAPLNDEDEDAP